MNGLMQYRQINLCQYPPETANILQRDIFWFFLKDEEFVSKTLNEDCADLQQYPASKVCQLAKKLLATSSKPSLMHRQPKLTFYTINILNCHKRRRKVTNKNNTSNPKTANHHTRNILTHHRLMAARIVAPYVVIPGMHKAFPVQQRNICARHVRSMDTLQAYAFQSRILHTKSQLRGWRITVTLKQMTTLIAKIVLYCTR